jgi:hypothetical protein
MSDWSSFDHDKEIMEKWRIYLDENEDIEEGFLGDMARKISRWGAGKKIKKMVGRGPAMVGSDEEEPPTPETPTPTPETPTPTPETPAPATPPVPRTIPGWGKFNNLFNRLGGSNDEVLRDKIDAHWDTLNHEQKKAIRSRIPADTLNSQQKDWLNSNLYSEENEKGNQPLLNEGEAHRWQQLVGIKKRVA